MKKHKPAPDMPHQPPPPPKRVKPPAGSTPLSAIHLNDGTHGLPKNPRFIRDERFRALCDSIRDNPEYMPARPIIVDEAGVILGGNMRFRACRDLKLDPLPAGWVQVVTGWTVEKKRRFILLDNNEFGEADWDELANGFQIEELLKGGFIEQQLGAFDEAIKKHEAELLKVDVRPPPKIAWVLIGVPIGSWGKVSGIAEAAALIPGSIVETTANDGTNKD